MTAEENAKLSDLATDNLENIAKTLGRPLTEYEEFLLSLLPEIHWRVFVSEVVMASLRLRLKAELGRSPTAEEMDSARKHLAQGILSMGGIARKIKHEKERAEQFSRNR